MASLRVFISYAHDDKALAGRIAAHLEVQDMMSLWDKNFSYGHGFLEEIKVFISYAHVFLPIITEASSGRGWVHQEIGYAMAMNVPVLPVTVGKLPPGMLQGLHAICLDNADADIRDLLQPSVIRGALSGQDDFKLALYRCADEAEERAEMMRAYADEIRQIGYEGTVRQNGGLSSFHIPDRAPTNRVFRDRYGGKGKGVFHARLQREERRALERHAHAKGCRLIVYPELDYREWGPKARIVRLKCLLEFLHSMPDDKVEIAHGPCLNEADGSSPGQGENVTIVGDWFSAVSISGQFSRGFRQTIFTRHAPTVGIQVERFDETFDEAFKARPWPKAPSSRLGAIAFLEELVSQLELQLGETVPLD